MTLTLRNSHTHGAFTIAEVVVSCAVAALFALAAFSTNQRLLNSIRDQRENAAASMALQERMERFRAASYSQIASTKPTYDNYVQNNVLTYNPSPSPAPTPAFPAAHGKSQGKSATFSEGPLGNLTETVTISGYQAAVSPSPSPNGSGQMTWIRDTSSGNGQPNQQANPDNNMATEYDILKVDILLQWTGTGGRSRSRELSALFGKGNIGQ